MTDDNVENPDPQEVEAAEVDIPLDPVALFASIMGDEEPSADGEAGAEGAAPADPAAGGDGQQPAAPEGAGAAPTDPAAPAGGDAAESPVARDASEYAANWSAALDGLETRLTNELTQSAVTDVRTEFAPYIEAVEQAPRYLIGKQVPRADGTEGTETLLDAQDARDWQDEIKKQLGREVTRRIEAARAENNGMMEVLNNSVQLFQSNPDIVPNSKQFDKELADEFTALIKPFEVRNDTGKLVGWKVDVKPMLVTLRQQLNNRRVASAASTSAPPQGTPTAQQERAAAQPRNEGGQWTNPDAPQAGIPSSAGQSGNDGENLDALFGSLGFAPGTFRF